MTPVLFDDWRELRGIFARAGLGDVGIELARHAFYCGAASAFGLLDPTLTPEQWAEVSEALRGEVRAFRFDIRRVRTDPQ